MSIRIVITSSVSLFLSIHLSMGVVLDRIKDKGVYELMSREVFGHFYTRQ